MPAHHDRCVCGNWKRRESRECYACWRQATYTKVVWDDPIAAAQDLNDYWRQLAASDPRGTSAA